LQLGGDLIERDEMKLDRLSGDFIAWVSVSGGFHPDETRFLSLINTLPTQQIC